MLQLGISSATRPRFRFGRSCTRGGTPRLQICPSPKSPPRRGFWVQPAGSRCSVECNCLCFLPIFNRNDPPFAAPQEPRRPQLRPAEALFSSFAEPSAGCAPNGNYIPFYSSAILGSRAGPTEIITSFRRAAAGSSPRTADTPRHAPAAPARPRRRPRRRKPAGR